MSDGELKKHLLDYIYENRYDRINDTTKMITDLSLEDKIIIHGLELLVEDGLIDDGDQRHPQQR
jgi:hypothetical protein